MRTPASVQDAISALTAADFVVETSGGRYTVAHGGEILLRQGNAGQLLIFASGVAAGFDAAMEMNARAASIERALEQSPAHRAMLEGRDGK